jgi:hypothetical protein
MEMIDDEPDLSIYDFNSIINYIKNNFIQIYLVDQISNINTMIMAPISMIPGIPQQPKNPPIKMPKGRKMSKK